MDLENRLNAELDGLIIAEKELIKARKNLEKAQSAYDRAQKKATDQKKNITTTENSLLTQINGQRKINSAYSDFILKCKALGLDASK